MSSLVVEGVPVEQTGVASGMNANIRTIGGSVGTAIMSSIIAATGHGRIFPTDAGYAHAFVLLTVALIACVGAALLVPVRRGPKPADPEKSMPHAELGIVAAGTLAGSEPE